ncbi:MAG TPA: transcriptional repressor [Candidatus Acidoferrum sp.]|nr:transcriptional repressor [Candidatus Acidoferrum sp.]
MHLRNTKQRAAIRDVLEHAERPLSVAEVLDEAARQVDGMGIATVYRSIATLLDEGWVECVELPGEPPRYERAGKAHHHHFRCTSCSRVFDISGCSGDLRGLVPPDFRLLGHVVTLYGLCGTCGAGSR